MEEINNKLIIWFDIPMSIVFEHIQIYGITEL